MKIGMAQINPIVGNLEFNMKKILEYIERSRKSGVDILIFPEMSITGYPPLDLIYENGFITENMECLNRIAARCTDIVVVVGFINREGGNIYNAAALIHNARLKGIVHKKLLPTYDVFDEERYFTEADEIKPLSLVMNGEPILLGIEICEDMWDKSSEYKVTQILADKGARIIFNISASPFYIGKVFERLRLLENHTRKTGLPMFYVNMVGGQDELVFDGNSMAVSREGKLIGLGKQFEEDLITVELNLLTGTGGNPRSIAYNREEEMLRALILGVRDYFRKSGFKSAVVGLSGGIDSSLTAVIAVEALGRENVRGVLMPSRYSSKASIEDAVKLAGNLGISYEIIPIDPIFLAFKKALERSFKDLPDDVTEENLQARIRGTLLMALSNKYGHLVLSTGNKTELALGYCTLYGDMSGGLAVISDVSKHDIYKLAGYYNSRKKSETIPGNILSKIPSAELKEGQVDPFDYDIVSPLVEDIIEGRKSNSEILKEGLSESLVKDIREKIRVAEYKRRQAPPGIKITPKAFGIGRKMPIVNHYTGG